MVIGITGSNGKTSVKDILTSMLTQRYATSKTKGNRNNEIGVPLTLLELSDDDQVAVVEMGMENLGEIDLLTHMVKPDIAIITNVGEAHLENLGSVANIARAKAEIVHGLKENGVLLYNGEQEVLEAALCARVTSGRHDRRKASAAARSRICFVMARSARMPKASASARI